MATNVFYSSWIGWKSENTCGLVEKMRINFSFGLLWEKNKKKIISKLECSSSYIQKMSLHNQQIEWWNCCTKPLFMWKNALFSMFTNSYLRTRSTLTHVEEHSPEQRDPKISLCNHTVPPATSKSNAEN